MDEPKPKPLLARLGKNVKLARIERDMSQEELALDAGMQRSALSRLERGLIDPKASTIVKLAKALEVEPGHLFAGVE